MKKILFALLSVFMCSVAMAAVKGFNDITDKGKIDWEALDASVTAFDSEATRAMVYEFFIENEGREISAKELLSWCYSISGQGAHLIECTNFVKKYFTYTGDGASDCTVASGIIGQDFAADGSKIDATTFNEVLRSCAQAEDGFTRMSGKGQEVESYGFNSDSKFGTCFRFMNHVKKCTRHLESYYAKELSKTDLDSKKKKQYSCILNLVQTGQLELPVNLMEKKCK